METQAPSSQPDAAQSTEQVVPAVPPANNAAQTTGKENTISRTHAIVKKWSEIIAPWAALIAIAAGAWAIKIALDNQVETAVEKKLSDPAILRKIAAESRPSLIFDANESIVAEMGAGTYVKDIQVTKWHNTEKTMPETIHIEFTRHMATPPIVTPVSAMAIVVAVRSKGYSWDFNIEYGGLTFAEKPKNLFRLDLVP